MKSTATCTEHNTAQQSTARTEIYRVDHTGRRLTLADASNWCIDLECSDEHAEATFTYLGVNAPDERFTAALRWDFANWHQQIYVYMPAAVYAGNRFPSLKLPYSPRLPEHLCQGVKTEPYITDIPRLGSGSPRLQLKSGDLSFPAFGWFDPLRKTAWLAWARQPETAADWVWEIHEHDHTTTWSVLTPGLRETPVYRMPMMSRQTPDRGWAPVHGDSRRIALGIRCWTCPDLAAFLDHIFTLTDLVALNHEVDATLPFSESARLIEEHYNRDNWQERFQLYASNCDAGAKYLFQTGWAGGVISCLPLLHSQTDTTRARAFTTLRTFLQKAPAPNGLFYGKMTAQGQWTSDFALDTAHPHTRHWTLVRRQADALYYLLRILDTLERQRPAAKPEPQWLEILRRAADAFTALWRNNGQFGQFIHQQTGEILVGNSTSGALVPAALALAWCRFANPEYLRVAQEAARYFAREFLDRGYTTGGPGDALQNPDSESIAALVESFAVLHTATGEPYWIERGRQAAALLATWVMPYNYPFAEGTEFQRLHIKTLGSVFANTQNKHSAPGICTHSGSGLLALYRASGDIRLLNLLQRIAAFIPQTLSRPDRPIHASDGRPLPPGWINERVNTSDWDENPGNVFYGSCWCEVSMLLTALELPGIYHDPEKKILRVFDHIHAQAHSDKLHLHNPTSYPASVKIFIERRQPHDPYWYLAAKPVILRPQERLALDISAL